MILPLPFLLAPLAAAETAATGAGEPALWRFARPSSQVVIGVDWSHIRQSQAGMLIRDQWLPRRALPGFPALELLDSIDRFLISLPGKGAGNDRSDDGADGGDSGSAEMLIAVQGHFDAARVRQLFHESGAKLQAYDSFQVYRPQAKANRDVAFVLFDPATILYGDAPSVFAALDRNRFAQPQAPVTGSTASRAAALEAKYEVWAIVETNAVMSNDPIADLFGAGEWADSAQGFEAGLNLGNGLDADFIVHFSSDVTAKRVVADLTSALAAAAKDRNIDRETQNIARKLKFNVDGSSAKISLRLNAPELEKVAQSLASSAKAGERLAAAKAPTASAAPAPPAAPSKPGVIRIEGLDDGPREIPFQDREQ